MTCSKEVGNEGSQVWPDQKIKTRCSDFGVSMGHHVATFILIVLPYIFRFARVESVVLALHDASDEKCPNTVVLKQLPALHLFYLFYLGSYCASFTTHSRFFGVQGFYEVLLTLDKERHKVEGPIYYYVFNSLLYCLLVLHIYR
ncbi:hypothetical protein Ahy_A07g036275 [Arachis hypogaea]|uniref:TLC domain-containing protein n=1 Tax=Arachis hypogaea TaxID=3818 RepID=A0A445CFQ9_ARAHY|nr:hypothetical protein Ahy_A07g036275 [Arachis hypogaea]